MLFSVRSAPAATAFVSSVPALATSCSPSTSFSRTLRPRPALPRSRRPHLAIRHAPRACTSPDAAAAAPTPTNALSRVSGVVTTLFPVWTMLSSLTALKWPGLFGALTAPWVIQAGLALLMLSMGLTIQPSELLVAMKRPAPLLFNMAACYLLMPAVALALCAAFGLSGPARAGLILLSIVSGGQASNLCTHIARGDVALSVTLTTGTTLAAAVALPALSTVLLGTTVPVDPRALALSTARVTLAPLAAGAALRALAPAPVSAIQPALPAMGVLAVVAIVLGPVSVCATGFGTACKTLLAPVLLLHVLGGLFGFVMPWCLGAGWRAALTIAFETGFKSPALSFMLASRFFPAGVELASAVSIVTLAPIAALCAVLIRAFTGTKDVTKK